MGKTTRTKDTIYLDQEVFAQVDSLSKATGVPRATLYRDGVQLILEKYDWTRQRATSGPPRNIHSLRLKKVPGAKKPRS